MNRVTRRATMLGCAFTPSAVNAAPSARVGERLPFTLVVSICPAAAIGREIAALAVSVNEADALWVATKGGSESAVHDRFRGLEAQLSAKRDQLSSVLASSVPGAMAQIMEAFALANGDGWMTAAAELRFHCLMVSAVNALEGLGGLSRETMGGGYLMARDFDGRAFEDGDSAFRPDPEIVDACAKACTLIASHRIKDADAPGSFETEEEEAAFYAEVREAEGIGNHVLTIRAFTVAGLQAKSRLHGAWLSIGDKDGAAELANSIASDLACGIFPCREAGA